MVDEIFDRFHQAGRQELHAGVDALFGKLGQAIRNAFEGACKGPVRRALDGKVQAGTL